MTIPIIRHQIMGAFDMENHYNKVKSELYKLSKLYEQEYELSNVLKSGAAKIARLSEKDEGTFIKAASGNSASER